MISIFAKVKIKQGSLNFTFQKISYFKIQVFFKFPGHWKKHKEREAVWWAHVPSWTGKTKTGILPSMMLLGGPPVPPALLVVLMTHSLQSIIGGTSAHSSHTSSPISLG
jgi:hypothetical protein